MSSFLFFFYFFIFSFICISWRLITLQYCGGFCHTLTWISHRFTRIPHPNPPSHLPLHLIPLGLPSAPGPSTMSSFNCRFLTWIRISQEAGNVVWYSHLLNNFPKFVVIHIVKVFGIVNKAEVDVELSFSMIQWMLAIWSLISLTFLNPAWTSIWKFRVHVLLKSGLENFEH